MLIRPTDTSSHCFTPCYSHNAVDIDSSYPEGNYWGNQLLDGTISLSPLYLDQEVTICTSVPHNASFHQVFTWLHHAQAKFTIFRVSTETFNAQLIFTKVKHLPKNKQMCVVGRWCGSIKRKNVPTFKSKITFVMPLHFKQYNDLRFSWTPWSVLQDGSNGCVCSKQNMTCC